jgi:hypothetical protein
VNELVLIVYGVIGERISTKTTAATSFSFGLLLFDTHASLCVIIITSLLYTTIINHEAIVFLADFSW